MGCADNPYWIGRYPGGDAGPAAGQIECETTYASALVCSSFEDDALEGGSARAVIENAGELELTGEQAHTGTRALRAASSDAMSVAALARTFEPVRQGELHMRAHVYVPEDLPTEIMNILFIGASPAAATFDGVDINLQGGALQTFAPGSEPARVTSELRIPRARWFCLRMRMDVREGDGVLELFVDDEPALRAAPIDTLPASGITELRVGIDWSSEQTESFEIYIDDLVLGTAPVACVAAP